VVTAGFAGRSLSKKNVGTRSLPAFPISVCCGVLGERNKAVSKAPYVGLPLKTGSSLKNVGGCAVPDSKGSRMLRTWACDEGIRERGDV
jgi:hypothetical protein